MLGVIDVIVSVVPAGNAVLVIVNVCEWLTSLTLVSGVMLTFASTYRLVTEPELPWVPSVVRLTLTEGGLAPASLSTKCQIAVAFAVIDAADELLAWNVHVAVLPLLLSVGAPHVL